MAIFNEMAFRPVAQKPSLGALNWAAYSYGGSLVPRNGEGSDRILWFERLLEPEEQAIMREFGKLYGFELVALRETSNNMGRHRKIK